MAYVPGFINDIFISFSHTDNLGGWVEDFQKRLNERLIQLGAPVCIWRDSTLRGTDVFSDEIFTQLQQSALLISVISPSGINSGWCIDERHAFERFSVLNGGFQFGNHVRAIKVVKTPLDGDQHRGLFDVLGFEFYRREAQSHRFREFHQSSPEFHQIIDELAQDIKSVLDAFRQHLLAVEADDKKKIIYVATTTPSLNWSRDAVVQQLEAWGYTAIPQSSEAPRCFSSFQAVTKAELAASSFSVHLVSDQPRPIVDGGQDSISGQYELAQRLKKDRIIWVEPGRKLYSNFDDALRNGLQNGVEILQNCDIENLKDVIGDKLKQKRRPTPSQKSEARTELYLICDRPDYPSEDSQVGQRALRIKEFLDENGLVVMPPPYSEMEWSELEEEHRSELQLSNGVLLYWGMASENWFLKIRRIIVNERIRRNKTSGADTLTEAFYFTNPPMKKSQYRNLTEFVFEQYDDFEPKALKPLLDRLLTNEEA